MLAQHLSQDRPLRAHHEKAAFEELFDSLIIIFICGHAREQHELR